MIAPTLIPTPKAARPARPELVVCRGCGQPWRREYVNAQNGLCWCCGRWGGRARWEWRQLTRMVRQADRDQMRGVEATRGRRGDQCARCGGQLHQDDWCVCREGR